MSGKDAQRPRSEPKRLAESSAADAQLVRREAKGSAESPARRLQQLAFRFREARALYAGLELGVFEAIGSGARAAPALADELRCDARGLRVLLGALVALGALERSGDGYRLAAGCAPLLLRAGGEYLGNLWLHDLWHWTSWARVERAVRSGEAQTDYGADPHLSDPEIAARFFSNYTRAMEQSAAEWLPALADEVAALAPRRVVDLGGGSGGLLLAVLERAPAARGQLLEHAFSLERARERCKAHPAAERLELVAANIERDPLPEADVVVLCRVLMGLAPPRAQALLARAAAALAPGGALVICDFDARSRMGALLSLDMLLHGGGEVYGAAVLAGWLASAGLAASEAKRSAPYLRTWIARRTAPAEGA